MKQLTSLYDLKTYWNWDVKPVFLKELQVYLKILNSISHWKNVKQNYNEVLIYITPDRLAST